MLTPSEVKERFCKLSNEVMHKVFEAAQPADCFCDTAKMTRCAEVGLGYEYSDKVMEFIENATRAAITDHEIAHRDRTHVYCTACGECITCNLRVCMKTDNGEHIAPVERVLTLNKVEVASGQPNPASR